MATPAARQSSGARQAGSVPIPGPGLPDLRLRAPTPGDGAEVWKMVAACRPLDRNSVYCNLLQCADFADTCILAEDGDRPVGWVSGYRPPDDQSALFIWQVAVLPEARGSGLAKTMILSLLRRPACAAVRRIKTTITPDNRASWALFSSLADSLQAPIGRRPWFDEEVHFKGRHDSEDLVTIGPFFQYDAVPDRLAEPAITATR